MFLLDACALKYQCIELRVLCVQIAGGSGITPMLQVASEIVNNPEDNTQVSLIFANQTERDIILKEEIDEMAAKHDNFQVGCVCVRSVIPAVYDHAHLHSVAE